MDLYFLLKDHYSLKALAKRARELFGDLFIELQFRQQLCYFDNIDYDEYINSLAENFLTEKLEIGCLKPHFRNINNIDSE